MVDYILQTPDLDVFGGPTSLDVSTDFGRAGVRGSTVWAGNGNPLTQLTTQEIAIGDLYINTNTNDQFYSWLYQYIPNVGGPTWERLLKLNPSQNSKISVIPFDENGLGDVDILISDITGDSTVSAAQFIIRYNLENASNEPVASSFLYSIETIGGEKTLRISITAAAFDGTDWSPLQGSHKVHTFVSYLS
jgi:hypothetical protein